jgi:AcrR family transcriptional regulator
MQGRGPYAKGVERREAILRTTLDVFSQLGYRGTTIRAIARELGIGSSLLHHYFPTREDLLIAVIDEWDSQNRRASDSPTFLQHFAASIRRNTSIPGLVHLYTALVVESCDPDHPAREFIDNRYAALTSSLADDIRGQQGDGRAPAGLDPERTARILIAACEGLQMRWLHEQSLDMAEEFAYLLDALGLTLDEAAATALPAEG